MARALVHLEGLPKRRGQGRCEAATGQSLGRGLGETPSLGEGPQSTAPAQARHHLEARVPGEVKVARQKEPQKAAVVVSCGAVSAVIRTIRTTKPAAGRAVGNDQPFNLSAAREA